MLAPPTFLKHFTEIIPELNSAATDVTHCPKKIPSTCWSKGFFFHQVEAAGIEPASRDISTKASTRVAEDLIFARAGVLRRTTDRTIQELYLVANVPGVNRDDPELATNFWISPEKIRSWWRRLLGSQDESILDS